MGSFHLSDLYIVVENQKFFAYKHKSVVFHRVLFEKLKSVQFWRTKRTQRTLKKMYALKKKYAFVRQSVQYGNTALYINKGVFKNSENLPDY